VDSEDDLQTFDGWLKYQGLDATSMAIEALTNWRTIYDEARQQTETNPAVGLMKLGTSYHSSGITLHVKSYGRKVLPPQKRQPLTGPFTGFTDLGIDSGFSPKGVGEICNPAAFSGVVKVASGTLGPRHGAIGTALVERGLKLPADYYTWANEIVAQGFFLMWTRMSSSPFCGRNRCSVKRSSRASYGQA